MVSFEQGAHGQLLVGEHAQGRIVVRLLGSWDLAMAEMLEERLCALVRQDRPRTMALDMVAVDFCDCAVLRVLLGVRAEGQRVGCEVVISAAAPAVVWLLDLLGLEGVFGHPPLEPGRGELSG